MKSKTLNMVYLNNCVGWNKRAVHCDGGLIDMIDNSLDITRETFLKHVDKAAIQDISDNLGYARHYKQGLTMNADWCVSYHRSKLFGNVVYYLRHSGIEYVFASLDDYDSLAELCC